MPLVFSFFLKILLQAVTHVSQYIQSASGFFLGSIFVGHTLKHALQLRHCDSLPGIIPTYKVSSSVITT